LIGTSQDNNNRKQAADSLEKICQDNPVAIVAVSGLKDCLTSEIYENDFIRYEICYKVIWDCAQNYDLPRILSSMAHSTHKFAHTRSQPPTKYRYPHTRQTTPTHR